MKILRDRGAWACSIETDSSTTIERRANIDRHCTRPTQPICPTPHLTYPAYPTYLPYLPYLPYLAS